MTAHLNSQKWKKKCPGRQSMHKPQSYQCVLCKKTLTRERSLIYHLVVVHYTRDYKLPKKYQCLTCFRPYSCQKALNKHVCPQSNATNQEHTRTSTKKRQEKVWTNPDFLYTPKTLIKEENEGEICVETDIVDSNVPNIDANVVLKPGNIKDEPVEVLENKADHLFEITYDTPIEPMQNGTMKVENHSPMESVRDDNHIKKECETSETMMQCNVCKTRFMNRQDYDKHIRTTCESFAEENIEKGCKKQDIGVFNGIRSEGRTSNILSHKPCAIKTPISNIVTKHELAEESGTDIIGGNKLTTESLADVNSDIWNQADRLATQINDGTYDQRSLACSKCSRCFASKSGLTQHVKITHPDLYKTWQAPSYSCNVCYKSFSKPSRLTRHQQTHKELKSLVKTEKQMESIWKCEKCKRHFANKAAMTNHIRKEHPVKYKTLQKPIYRCVTCERDFPSPSKLLKHKETRCNQGQEGKSSSLSGHIATHKNDRNKLNESLTGMKPQISNPNQSELPSSGSGAPLKCEVTRDGPNQDMEAVHQIEQSALNVKTEPQRIVRVSDASTETRLKSAVSDSNICSIEKSVAKVKCHICYVSFSNEVEIKHHIRRVHAFRCMICNRYFGNRKRFTSHMAIHHRNENSKTEGNFSTGGNSKCACCFQMFATRAELTTHIINEHAEPSGTLGADNPGDLTCRSCGRKLGNKAALTNHLRISHPDIFKTLKQPVYRCRKCSKAFTKPSKLAVHAAIHRDTSAKRASSVWDCPGCEHNFSSKDALVSHIRDVHADPSPDNHPTLNNADLSCCNQSDLNINQGGESQKDNSESQGESRQDCSWKCRHCDAVFDHPLRLAQHTTTHTGFKKYQCRDCSYGTHNNMALLGHVRKHHTHVLPYQCFLCGLQFALSSILNKHMCRKHPSSLSPVKPRPWRRKNRPLEKPKIACRYKGIFPCHRCERVYNYSSTLQDHIRRDHLGIRIPCLICSKTFASRGILRDHVKTAHSDSKPFR